MVGIKPPSQTRLGGSSAYFIFGKTIRKQQTMVKLQLAASAIVPAPLKIVKYYGNDDLAQIASEILGLSKMNWNSFGLYSKLPCTIQSSNAIAKVGWLLPQYEGMIYEYRNFM